MKAPEAKAAVNFFHGVDNADGWVDFLDELYRLVAGKYPSFSEVSEWYGPGMHSIAENSFAYVVVMESNGVAVVNLVPKAQQNPCMSGLARHWVNQVSKGFGAMLSNQYRLPRSAASSLAMYI